MKSERRHELQQNDLAIYLDRINKSIEPYSRIIAIVVAGLFIGAIALMYYSSEQSGKRSVATFDLIKASASQDSEVLLEVGERYPDTIAGAWARIYQGRQYLVEGIQALYNDRENAEQLLADAQAAFRNAMASSNDPLLRSRAHFGIARALESLGDVDAAIESYGDVIAVNESEAMVKEANDRIETLTHPRTQEFLAWFSDQDFSPADPSLPPSMLGGDSLSDGPDFKLPGLDLPGLDLPGLDLGLELPGVDLKAGGGQELGEGGIEMPEKSPSEANENATSAEGDSANSDDTPAADGDPPADDSPAATDDSPAATEDSPAATEDSPAATEDSPAATDDAEAASEDEAATSEKGAAKPSPAEPATDDSASDDGSDP
jgi:hypothetical protein